MDSSEYDLQFFHQGGFHRSTCVVCGHAFWTLGDFDRCQEAPCRDYGFIGHPILARPYDLRTMRETYLSFFERHGHTRIRRYPTVARWRNDVFFTQASIYDFQPWVTNGTIPPPANPLTISQPVLRFIDLEEVGRSGRHFTLFEMMAHHAFNRPDHEVYFKERCTELCHELLTSELGADPKSITYKEEEWEGGGNVGPSLSVSVAGLELATLVFMMYVREGDRLKPMPLRVVDTGYGLERFVWASRGSKTAYEAVFGPEYEELRRTFPARETALLIDHARALNFLLTDGVVPSNSKEGYFVRLLLRRSLRILQKTPEAPDILSVLDRAGREIARDFPEVGAHRDDLHQVVLAEVDRYADAITRARQTIRRYEERVRSTGGRVGEETLVEWYDSLGVPPDVAVEELEQPPAIPEDFYARVAERHENEGPTSDYADATEGLPEVPESVPPTEVLYYLDPYTTNFEAHVVSGPRFVRRARPDLLLPYRGRPGHRQGLPRGPRGGRRRASGSVGAPPPRAERSVHGRRTGPWQGGRAAPDAAHAAPYGDAPSQRGAARGPRAARLANRRVQGPRGRSHRYHALPSPLEGGAPQGRAPGQRSGPGGPTGEELLRNARRGGAEVRLHALPGRCGARSRPADRRGTRL